MDFEKYQKLEKKIKKQGFSKSYRLTNIGAFAFSIFGNCASIFFAYFLLFSILKDSMPDVENTIGISIISVLFLFMFEMLKRFVFNKFSLEHIRAKFKFLTKEVITLALFSMMMVAGSFYLSLNGAQKFTDQLENIEKQSNDQFTIYQDSLNNVYSEKIENVEQKNTSLRDQNNTLTSENIKINEEAEEIRSYSVKRVKYKLIEQNNARIDKNLEKIDNNDEKISSLEEERNNKLLVKKEELEEDASSMIDKGSKNSIKFIILSTFIELVILITIYFNSFYNYKSVKEYEENMKADPNFEKWRNYDRLLDLIYDNGANTTRVGDSTVSMSKLEDLARINNFTRMDRKVISDGFKVLNHLGIVHTKGSKRIIEVDFEIAKEVLKDYFNIN